MYPTIYPYQMPQVPQLQQLAQPAQTFSIPYVNGKASAESYQMPANSSVILMDSEKSRFYVKQTDASGVATIKTYDFKESDADKPVEYVTKTEFEQFKAKMKGGGNRNESSNDVRKQQ